MLSTTAYLYLTLHKHYLLAKFSTFQWNRMMFLFRYEGTVLRKIDPPKAIQLCLPFILYRTCFLRLL